MDNPLCQCGCGKPVRMSHHKYVVGHNRRGKTNPKTEIGIKKWKDSMKRRRWTPIPSWLFFMDNPLCACGCGGYVSSPYNKYIHRHGTKGVKRPDLIGREPWNRRKTNDQSSPNYDPRIPIAWNKNLTKETDPRVAETSKTLKDRPQPLGQIARMRETKLRKFASGEIVAWNKGLKTGPLSEEHLQKLGLARIGREFTESTRQKIGKKVKAHWESLTHDEQRNYLNNSLFKAKTKPNGEELRLIPILSTMGFSYNTIAIVGPRRPDFIHCDGMHLIEYDGAGGHDPRVPQVPENKPELDDLRDQEYKAAGKKILRLLPEDLRLGEEHTTQKVKKWMNLETDRTSVRELFA